ncbi:MAG: bifunctional phosphopantothenoylcysteine decarboxylase/phosphopantothenate--cysteine ligase CoaBC [Bacteriovoracaceae bacterium]
MKVLLAVTGSIACYKSYDLAREMVKKGDIVKVILSKGALKFIRPELFRYLGVESVYLPNDDFNLSQYQERSSGQVLHIELARWCDRLVVAPASANMLKKLSSGEATDLLTSVFLSIGNKPIAIYPAMNTEMLNHPFTQDHLRNLSRLPNLFLASTQEGILACGEIGVGKLHSVETILNTYDIKSTKPAQNKTVLITTGATIAPLDPIRFMTNGSSGITGFHLARKFLSENYKVVVIAGQNAVTKLDDLTTLKNFKLVRVVTAKEMEEAVKNEFPTCDLYVSSAAVGDFEFNLADEKIKKSNLKESLPIRPSVDILAETLKLRKHQKIIGFAAETSTTSETFKEKYERKKVDLLIGNPVNTSYSGIAAKGFGTEDNQYFFIEEGKIQSTGSFSKSDLADKIFEWYTC